MWSSRLMYALSLVSSLLLIRYYDDTALGFTFLYALLLMLAFSLAAALFAPLCLKIDENADRLELFKGESLCYSARIVNRGLFFYPRVKIGYHDHELIDYGPRDASLPPRRTFSAEKDISFPYRGVYMLGVENITVTDFLGLFHVTFAVDDPFRITVCPEADEDFALSAGADSPDATHRADPFSESYADIADVRKYEPSDSLRKIHWKLSAKRAELMVKNYHSFDPVKTLLFIDAVENPLTGVEKAAYEDRLACRAAAAVSHCMQCRQPALLICAGTHTDEAEVEPDGDPLTLYRLLAGMVFDRPGSAFPAWRESMGSRLSAFNLVLFLPSLDEDVFEAVKAAHSRDRRLTVHFFPRPVEDDPGEAERLAALQALGVSVWIIDN